MPPNAEPLVTNQIKEWLERAETEEVQHADPWRWKAAEAMHKTYHGGQFSQRALGKEVALSQSTVCHYIRLWETYGDVLDRPSFARAFDNSKNKAGD